MSEPRKSAHTQWMASQRASSEVPLRYRGSETRKAHPLYTTAASEYGKRPQAAEEKPTVYNPTTSKFSTLYGTGGMYRNNGLNTAIDRTRV